MPNHITLDQSKTFGQKGRNLQAKASDFLNTLRDTRNFMAQTYLNTGSADSDFASFVTLGFGATNAEAHNGYAQIDNMLTALSTNASQTSVMDKMNQLIDFLGGN